MEIITNINQLDVNKRYSYADYLRWQFAEMVELIKGRLFMYSPAPASYHQNIVGNLHGIFYAIFKHQSCKLFMAPFDVRLTTTNEQTNEAITTVVQPDLCVICDRNKIDERGCLGAPDWIVEVASPSTAKKDLNDKYNVYQETGVREYWVVNPEGKYINQYVPDANGIYQLQQTVFEKDNISPAIFPELLIDVKDVFLW